MIDSGTDRPESRRHCHGWHGGRHYDIHRDRRGRDRHPGSRSDGLWYRSQTITIDTGANRETSVVVSTAAAAEAAAQSPSRRSLLRTLPVHRYRAAASPSRARWPERIPAGLRLSAAPPRPVRPTSTTGLEAPQGIELCYGSPGAILHRPRCIPSQKSTASSSEALALRRARRRDPESRGLFHLREIGAKSIIVVRDAAAAA